MAWTHQLSQINNGAFLQLLRDILGLRRCNNMEHGKTRFLFYKGLAILGLMGPFFIIIWKAMDSYSVPFLSKQVKK